MSIPAITVEASEDDDNEWNELRIPWKPGLIKATACIDDAYLQYISYFGSKSGNVQLGTTTDGDYYVQWFTNGTAIIAWTDGYLYGYVRGTWQPFGIAWQQQV
ncbi:MAG: hypothetical protein HQK97_12015 [Nitrospirae bacterium]|nr:hypothetical protein [Nitrospirota bacterium]